MGWLPSMALQQHPNQTPASHSDRRCLHSPLPLPPHPALCMHAGLWACVYFCVSASAYTHTCTHTDTHSHKHTHVQACQHLKHNGAYMAVFFLFYCKVPRTVRYVLYKCSIIVTMKGFGLLGGSVWLYEAVLLVFALYLWPYLVLMYSVLYRVLSYWYLLCSRKANFYVIHRQ